MFSKNFIGSNIAFVIGVLAILAGLANPHGTLFAGIYIILGTLAYKSLKKRKMGLVQDSKLRRILEVGAMVMVILLVVRQNNLQENLINDPFSNIVIPFWIIVAYLVVYFRTKKVKTGEQ